MTICIAYYYWMFVGGADYVPLPDTTLTFTFSSLQRQCVNIGIIDDSEVELVEQFFVQLDQTTSQGPISSQAVVSIVNGTKINNKTLALFTIPFPF